MTMLNEGAQLTLPSDREILIERRFRAKPVAVFELWSRPEHVRAWYLCPSLSMPVCEIDFRIGGRWRWVTHNSENGMDYPLSGEYRDISKPERIVFTQRFEPFPSGEHVITLSFEERDGQTLFRQHILHTSQENRDGHLKSGFTNGLDDLFERVDALLGTGVAA
ncbi:MAG: SRPBCC domain-containing protein [Myxococcota bacterium]